MAPGALAPTLSGRQTKEIPFAIMQLRDCTGPLWRLQNSQAGNLDRTRPEPRPLRNEVPSLSRIMDVRPMCWCHSKNIGGLPKSRKVLRTPWQSRNLRKLNHLAYNIDKLHEKSDLS